MQPKASPYRNIWEAEETLPPLGRKISQKRETRKKKKTKPTSKVRATDSATERLERIQRKILTRLWNSKVRDCSDS